MTKELYIRMIENGKETELSVSNPTIDLENMLLAGVLSFMDITLSKEFLQMQKMYSEFYNGTFNPEIMETNEEVIVTIQPTEYENMSDAELFRIGMKRNKLNKLVYRCVYKCDKCDYSGTHYILPTQSKVPCRNCNNDLSVREVPDAPDVQKVYYYAGNYKK